MPEALLDEVNVAGRMAGRLRSAVSSEEFLQVPQECLILTMQTNQKYFALTDANGKLRSRFLIVSNIETKTPGDIVEGNERVVRPRLADAKFFFEQDKKKPLADRVPLLANVVYHNKLGSALQRVERVEALARRDRADDRRRRRARRSAPRVSRRPICSPTWSANSPSCKARWARTTRATTASRKKSRSRARSTISRASPATTLPVDRRRHARSRSRTSWKRSSASGASACNRPAKKTRSRCAVMRSACCAFWSKSSLPIDLRRTAARRSRAIRRQCRKSPIRRKPSTRSSWTACAACCANAATTPSEIDAVLSLNPTRLDDIVARLDAVREFAALPEAASLAAANKRISNILKKSDRRARPAACKPALLVEAAEKALHAQLEQVAPRVQSQLAARDYTGALTALAALREPVDTFFNDVMVNAEDPALRTNRLALARRAASADELRRRHFRSSPPERARHAMNQRKLVILDRDGVINVDSDAFIKSPDEWVAIPGQPRSDRASEPGRLSRGDRDRTSRASAAVCSTWPRSTRCI